MMAAAPKVFILILHWQKYEVTRNCLASFRTLEYSHYQIIVLDNASTNDSAHRLEKEFPECLFIFNKENKGYGAGMNPGIRYALDHGGAYIFLLNNDVIVNQPEFLQLLLQFMESHPQVGIAGPKLLFADGSYQRSYRYGFLSLALGFWSIEKIRTLWGRMQKKTDQGSITHRVDWLNAVALLFKRQVFEDIGLMDERFFLGAEDVDLSLRARQKEWETWYCAKSELTHLSFTSHDNAGSAGYDRFWVESTLLFLQKYYTFPVVLFVRMAMVLGLFLRGIQWFFLGLFNRKYFKRAKTFFTISCYTIISRPKFANKI